MKLRCRLGFHKMMSHTTSEMNGDEIIVYDWNFCQREECRYSIPTLMEVTRFKPKRVPFDQER